MQQPNQIRQGDVLLVAIPRLPKGVTLRARKEQFVVLAYGEVTGHAHAVDDRRAAFPAELYDSDRGTFLKVAPGTVLVHTDRFNNVPLDEMLDTTEEHDTVLVERTYKVVNQRQYTPWGEQAVRD